MIQCAERSSCILPGFWAHCITIFFAEKARESLMVNILDFKIGRHALRESLHSAKALQLFRLPVDCRGQSGKLLLRAGCIAGVNAIVASAYDHGGVAGVFSARVNGMVEPGTVSKILR